MRLIICEKDNAAKRISGILSDNSAKTEKKGRVSVYRFQWEGEDACTIGLRGHIMNLDFPKKYNSWTSINPAELVDLEPIKILSERSIGPILRSLAKESSSIYVATDYDREGELIGVEAVEYAVGKEMVKEAHRVRFSSLTHSDVTDAFHHLVKVDEALASAAETRQVMDLIWGATLTRFISLASNRLGHDFLSVGRVQSPTLAIIVNKEKDIKAFKPRPYWNIEGDFEKGGMGFPGSHSAGDIFDGEKANMIFARVENIDRAEVVKVSQKEKVEKPPIPFNTTEFIKAANSTGMSVSRVMSIAEDLYTKGYISYPRTDNTVYPKGLDIRKTVQALAQGPYRVSADSILEGSSITPTRGKKETTDHPPIYPTAYITKDQIGPEKYRLYDLVVRRFLATLMEPSRKMIKSVKLDVGGEVFKVSGIRMIYPGWRSVYTISRVKESILPELVEGSFVDVKDLRLESKETKPPKRFSQGGLIQEMERLGLGTKSTRHEIIQKLYDRRYIDEVPPRPTLSGEALILALENHASLICEPDMTSRLDEDMERISKGSLSQEKVLEESREMLKSFLEVMEREKKAIGREISSALMIQDIAGTCPRCNNDLLVTRSMRGKRYVRCSMHPNCSRSYPLPQRGKIDFTKESCTACKSPIVIFYRRGKPPYNACINPKCPLRTSKGEDDEK